MVTQEVTDPESVISTFTVVSPPPDTTTPTHHTLVPLFNPTLMVLPEGADVGGALVGVVGLVVGAAVAAPEEEEDPEEEDPEEEEPDL
jgi:hypothetical protein